MTQLTNAAIMAARQAYGDPDRRRTETRMTDIPTGCPAITTCAGVLDWHAECELPAGHAGPHSDHPQAVGYRIEWPPPE